MSDAAEITPLSLDGVLLTSAERWFFRNRPELPSRDASLRSAIRLAAAESLARKAGAWTEWLTTKPSRSLLALHVGLCTWVEQVPGGPHPISSQRVIEAHMTLKHQDAILLHMDSDPDGPEPEGNQGNPRQPRSGSGLLDRDSALSA